MEHRATKGKSSAPWLCLLQALNPTFRASLDSRTCSGSKAEVQEMGATDTLTHNKHNLQSLCKRLYTCPTMLHFLFLHTIWSIGQTPIKQWDFCLCTCIFSEASSSQELIPVPYNQAAKCITFPQHNFFFFFLMHYGNYSINKNNVFH